MIWMQVITALFAVALAWANKWPVIIFRQEVEQGHKLEKEYHAANAGVKIIMAFELCIFYPSPTLLHRLAVVVLLLLIQWLFFDIALNLFTGKRWDYLGKTAWLDRLVKNGKIKAAIVLLTIILINIFI